MDWLCTIKDDQEALAVLSTLGFSIRDWSFINKVGGALKVLNSDLIQEVLAKRCDENSYLHGRLQKIRAGFDAFYQSSGFLITPQGALGDRLFKVGKAPLVFYGRHNQSLLKSKFAVAIVGSRQAKDEALAITKTLSQSLARAGITVVSGGAAGIDRAAHLGAVESLGGSTTIVSGTSCDFKDSRALAWLGSQEKSLAIYPFGPFVPQSKFMFVERNRYVCALSDAVVIVQGKIGSGTLHTASFAHKLNIPIYAVPGSLLDPLSYAPNYLLANGLAKALCDFDQFAATMANNGQNRVDDLKKATKADKQAHDLEKEKELPYLLQVIREHGNSLGFDELIKMTGKSFGDLQKELLSHELSGDLIKRGTQFVLTAK